MTSESKPAEVAPSSAEVEQWLIAQIAAELQIAPETIQADRSLLSYGIDSMQAVAVIAKTEDWLGFRYTINPLEEFATIAELANDAAAQSAAQAPDPHKDD